MKTLGIVTDGYTSLDIFLKENIKMIFKDYLKINTYFLKDLKEKDYIDDDLIITMTDERALALRDHVNDSQKIIVVNRTIMENDIYKLFLIPKDTNVLVINDNKDTTVEMVSLLYRIGINHLNLIPYETETEYPDIKVAITPGESKHILDNIAEVIDLGHRYIDVSTFLTIMTKLNIDNMDISKRMIEYSEKVISLDTGIKNKYKELYTKNEDLDMIINLSRNAIVLTDENGCISVYNKSFETIFETIGDLHGLQLSNIWGEELMTLLDECDIKDEVIKYKNKYLNVNKCCVKHFEKNRGVYFNVQEITYIKKLEQNLSRKLSEKGHTAKNTFNDIITNSAKLTQSIELAKKIAKSDLTVLITGESGTGKEVFAQSIHNESNRRMKPFVAINCAAMPENLLESELFGYVEGAFTGAKKGGKPGLFEQANNGTLFLDEIGDMPLHLQTKFLRVLQEQQVMRIGADKIIEIDVRIIGATNQDFAQMIDEKRFRSDLYYRLNVLPINIPPLRERKEDIQILMTHFIGSDTEISQDALHVLTSYNWPGNVRELVNVASYISLMSKNNIVQISDLPYNLTQNIEIPSRCLDMIEATPCNTLTLNILRIIYNHNVKGKSIGRKLLLKTLLDHNIFATEGEVRKLLHEMKLQKLVFSNSGRGGTKITDRGIKYLNDNLNNKRQ